MTDDEWGAGVCPKGQKLWDEHVMAGYLMTRYRRYQKHIEGCKKCQRLLGMDKATLQFIKEHKDDAQLGKSRCARCGNPCGASLERPENRGQ